MAASYTKEALNKSDLSFPRRLEFIKMAVLALTVVPVQWLGFPDAEYMEQVEYKQIFLFPAFRTAHL